MKKVLLVVSLISVLLLAGCNNNENIVNNDSSNNTDSQQQEIVDRNEEKIVDETISREEQEEVVKKNKYIITKNEPITYTSDGWDNAPDRIGEFKTYETINIENPNNDESIAKINEFLNNWKSYIDESEYEVELPKDIDYTQDIHYIFSEYYQNGRVIVINEHYYGASGGGAANSSDTYYVFDKNTGNRLTIKDISNDADALMEYIFYKPVMDDDVSNSWWNIGLESSSSLPKDLNDYKNSFEGTWAIDKNGIVISRSWAMSGPIFTLNYDLNDIKSALYQNINEEYFE
ncbi:MAG: hypothetical protein IJ215_04360 [Clostridia bacterium]|nr:hypothetical protein [Clostridia bacterium]